LKLCPQSDHARPAESGDAADKPGVAAALILAFTEASCGVNEFVA
jgi:hypothetical protein